MFDKKIKRALTGNSFNGHTHIYVEVQEITNLKGTPFEWISNIESYDIHFYQDLMLKIKNTKNSLSDDKNQECLNEIMIKANCDLDTAKYILTQLTK